MLGEIQRAGWRPRAVTADCNRIDDSAMTVTRYPIMQSRRDIGLRFLRLTLAAQRALPEPFPASLRGPPHVRHAEAHRAGDALPRLSRAGQLVPEPARLRDPASRASCVQRHR